MWLTRSAANLAIRTKILLSFAFILALLADWAAPRCSAPLQPTPQSNR